MMTTPPQIWRALVTEVPAAIADELVGAAGPWMRGAQFHPTGPGRTRLQLFLRADIDPDVARDELASLASALGAPALDVGVETVEDDGWVERYQASLKPFPLGTRYHVFPAGDVHDTPCERPLVLVPGRAFGTGEHATTASCVDLLEKHVASGSRWIDLGCGSGILSLVAADLGASEILAVEIDTEVLEVAGRVLERNGAPPQVELRHGGVDSITGESWDGIVANIHAPIFHETAGDLAGFLRPGGLLIASGFVDDQARGVCDALERAGFEMVERIDREPWCAVTFRRRAA